MELNPMEMVLKNPYLLSKIMERLDVRSLYDCHSVCQQWYWAAAYESERRKEIIRSYHGIVGFGPTHPQNTPYLVQEFLRYTKFQLNMRPKYELISLLTDQHNPTDHRRRVSQKLSQNLPNNCSVIYFDRLKEFNWCGSIKSLLIPDIDGLQIRTYNRIEEIDRTGVKCVLLFLSFKKLSRKTSIERTEEIEATAEGLSQLMSSFEYNISFGGGAVEAVKRLLTGTTAEPLLSEHLFITFSGNSIRTASAVISTSSPDIYRQQLLDFKNQLDFNCDDITNRVTIGFTFAKNLSAFTFTFADLFPAICHIPILTYQRMYGKNYTGADIHPLNSVFNPNIDPDNNIVLVLISIETNYKFSDFSEYI